MRDPSAGWLTVKQACRRLKVSRATLFRMIDQGELPAYRIGHWIRLRVADVEAYERDQRGNPSC
jgi:excisionase family DNA binding protein